MEKTFEEIVQLIKQSRENIDCNALKIVDRQEIDFYTYLL